MIQVLYCLALEHTRDGDLSRYLHRTGKPWAEATVRREIAGILQVLVKLHRGQLLHRDLTPLNVLCVTIHASSSATSASSGSRAIGAV